MNYRLAIALLGAASLAACAAHNGSTLPASPVMQFPQSIVSSGGVTTVGGTIVAIKTSTEYEVYAGGGCGYVYVYTSSTTTYSPSTMRPAAGDYAAANGSGGCASFKASSVDLMPASETIGAGEIFGADNVFSPYDGDTSKGGQGQTVDGIPCATTMPNSYHVHSFVGIIINGRQLAHPDGTGMKNPSSDTTYNGIPNWTEYASCYYYIHTHDASGVMHIESPSTASPSTNLYTLGNAFDVWGEPLSSTPIGPYTGTVRAYVANVPLQTTQISRSSYTLFTGNPRSIPLHSHTTTWLEIGPTYVPPSNLPVLHYYEEY